MITDTELKVQGIKTLIKTLGELNAERFITLLLREPFDYTKWQRTLWTEKSIEDISQMAMHSRLTSVASDAAAPPAGEGETRTNGSALEGSAPPPPRG